MKKPLFENSDDIKDFVIEVLKNKDTTNITVYEILNVVRSPKCIITFEEHTKKIKEVVPGQETIPRKGFIDVIDNDFWEMQDPGLKRLFPEIRGDNNLFEFLIMIIDDVRINPRTDKIEIVQNRYKFSTPMSCFSEYDSEE